MSGWTFTDTILHVLSDFDFDAFRVIFARGVNYDYYLIKYAKVSIFIDIVYWPP